MGRTYSINGYLNAALRRSGRTMLVEGPSDKALLHRLIANRLPNFNSAAVIDHAGIIDDPILSGLGNKARVVHIKNSAQNLSATTEKITSKFGTLTDREWDGLTIKSYAPDPEWHPPMQMENNFITLGHSIENYNFDIDYIKEYLKFSFPENISDNLLIALNNHFNAILVFASVLSFKLKDESILSRGTGLISPNHLKLENGHIYLLQGFEQACTARQINCARTIVQDVNSGIDLAWNKLHACEATKWLPHGHVGSDAIWVGVAHIAGLNGFPQDLLSELARGNKKHRELFQAQWLSHEQIEKRAPLDASLDWLTGT